MILHRPFTRICFLILFSSLFFLASSTEEDRVHQRPDGYKTQSGWQEPGFWRPKWIMDRTFLDEEGNTVRKDRLFLKMKSDRTIQILSKRSRPFFEWYSTKTDVASTPGAPENQRKIFESGKEAVPDAKEQMKILREKEDELFNVDGTWWWRDEAPLPTGRVKIETREGESNERLRHETTCRWGNLDGYAAKFDIGKIFKFKGVKKGSDIPVGSYVAGTFKMRANIHRPLVSKDFQAFQ